ncbi:serine-threonine protein kinase 19-domain-containing protein [Absidia repens]|uniref:Serine-threonine protein kinase 19-domain-containing protein n=1 Tax=Absidia repens TaxID=90262 RepID=A0A1X2IY17_9FUNG|nr:serine-threonine protein kinase 19-domain-containing protein [Absidia repens]
MNSSQKRSRAYYTTVIEKSDYGIRPLDPDVYGNKKRATRRIKEQLEQANDNDGDPDDDDDFNGQAVVSDSIATAQYLIKNLMLPSNGMTKVTNLKLPPVCFIHQIYSILRDNTAVDREIQYAIKLGSWRKFHILGTLDDEYALMDTKDYLQMVTDAKQEFLQDISSGINKEDNDIDTDLFDRFKRLLLNEQYFDTSVARQTLLSSSPTSSSSKKDCFTDKELTLLCKYGLLLPHMKKDSYWFAIRRQGIFMSSYIKGRKELLRILKKRSTKDIMEKLLKAKKLRQTVFSYEFILHDLIGSGRAERYKTSMGDLIKLTRKGELGQ